MSRIKMKLNLNHLFQQQNKNCMITDTNKFSTAKKSDYMHNTFTKATLNSYLSTVSYLPAQQVISNNKYVPQPKLNKFKKNRRQLKTTNSYLLDQTTQKNQKFCMKVTQNAYVDHLYDDTLSTRREFNEGQFKRLLERRDQDILSPRFYLNSRSVQDFGAIRNRLKMDELASTRNKRNPIKGEVLVQKNQSLQKNWKQQRRHRDNGVECKKTLQWNTVKKKNTYAELHKKKFQ